MKLRSFVGSLDGNDGTTPKRDASATQPFNSIGLVGSGPLSSVGQASRIVCQETAVVFIMLFFIRSNPIQSNSIHSTEEADACHLGLKAP